MRYRYKLWYPSPSDPAALETWLEEQSAGGWRPVRLKSTAKLERREPEPIRYHLEPALQGVTPRPELLESFSDAGWQYVCTAGSLYYLFAAASPHPAEPHTDPAAEAWAFQRLEHNRAVDFTLLLILWGLYGLYRWQESRFSLLRFLEMEPAAQLLWLLLQIGWAVSLLGGAACSWLRLRRLRKRLAAGEALPRRKGWRTQRGLWLTELLAIAVLIGGTLVYAGLRQAPWRETSPASVPVPALTELAGRELAVQSGAHSLDMAFLTEVSVWQSEVPSSESLSCRYAALDPGFLAPLVWRGELRQAKRNILSSELDLRQDSGGWDQVAVGRDSLGRQYLLAQREGLFLLAQYDGAGDLAACLPGLTEAAEAWKEEP